MKHKLFQGMVDGAIATVPMSLTMLLSRFFFPDHSRKELPPKQITDKLIDQVAEPSQVKKPERQLAAIVSHFGFGAAAGALYAPLHKHLPGSAVSKGSVFGLVVWATSYVGWLPALHLQPRAAHQPKGRNISMILAHLVWGISLAVLVRRLDERTSKHAAAEARQ